MGIRAHRITEVKYSDYDSFSTHDEELLDFIQSNNDGGYYDQVNMDGVGHVVVAVSVLRAAIAKAAELHIDADTVKVLRRDIAAAKKQGDSSVTYSMF